MELGQSKKQKRAGYLIFTLAFMTVFVLISGFAAIWIISNLNGPDPSKATRSIIHAAIAGDERYVIEFDESKRRRELPAVSIERAAWNILISHSTELATATVQVATKGNDMDLVSSTIQITGKSSVIKCLSDNGQVASPRYFYVYTCTVTTKVP
jgi:hypothetical protein